MKETYKILKDARQLIKDHGWIQGVFGNSEKGFCALGAVIEAKHRQPHKLSSDVAEFKLSDAVKSLWGSSIGIAAFNDSSHTTKEDVLKAFTLAMRLSR